MIIRHAAPRRAALSSLSGAGGRALFDGLQDYAQAEMRGFGAWDPATEARAVIVKVKLAYAAGAGVKSLLPLDFDDLLIKSNPFYAIEALIRPESVPSSVSAAAKAYKDLGAFIDDWADRKFRWAEAGKRDDGTPYSWKRWGDLGQVYLDSISYQTALPVTDGLFANAATAVREFLASVGTIFKPTEWPTWAKVAAGAAGLVAAAYVINTVRGPRR